MTQLRVRVDWDDNQFLSLQESDGVSCTPLIDPENNKFGSNTNNFVYIQNFQEVYSNNNLPLGDYFNQTTAINANTDWTLANLLSEEIDEFGLWKFDYNVRNSASSDISSRTTAASHVSINLPQGAAAPNQYKVVFWVRYKPGTTPDSTTLYVELLKSTTPTWYIDPSTYNYTLTDEWQRVEIEFYADLILENPLSFYFIEPSPSGGPYNTHLQIKGLQFGLASSAFSDTHTVYGNNVARFENVSDDVLSANWQLGVTENTAAINSVPKRIADEGTASILLYNDDGLYSPDNTSSPLSGFLIPGKKVLIEVQDTQSGEFHVVWAGYLRSLTPNIESGSTPTIMLEASQGFFSMEKALVPEKTIVSQTSDLTLKELLVNSPFVSPAEVALFRTGVGGALTTRFGDNSNYLGTFDTGDTTLDAISYDGTTNLLDAVKEIMSDEQGLFWIDRDGKLQFRKRTAYVTPTIEDSLIVDTETNSADFEYRYEQPNAIQVSYTAKVTATGYPGNRYWQDTTVINGPGAVSGGQMRLGNTELDIPVMLNIAAYSFDDFSQSLPGEYIDSEGNTWNVTWLEDTQILVPYEDKDEAYNEPSCGYMFGDPGYGTPEDYDGATFGRFVGMVWDVTAGAFIDIAAYTASADLGIAYQDFPVRFVITVENNSLKGRVQSAHVNPIHAYVTSFPWTYTRTLNAVYNVGDAATFEAIKSENVMQLSLVNVSSQTEAESIGDDLLAQLKDPEGMFRSITLKERTLDHIWFERMVDYRIGDVLQLTHNVSGVTDKDHLIIQETGEWLPGQFTMKFGLRRV